MPGLAEGGVVEYRELGCWVVTDPATTRAALGERRLSSASLARCLDLYMSGPARDRYGRLEEILTQWLVQIDGPDHAELRKRLSPALSPARVRAFEPEIERIVDEALDRLAAAAHPDAVAAVSDVIPAKVMGRLLTLPDVDVALLYQWTRAVSTFLDGVYREGAADRAQRALGEMFEQLAAVSAEGGQAGGIWDHLAEGTHRLATASMMLFGGLETTASLLGSVLHHVLAEPATAARIRAEGAPAAQAVTEEVLRTRPPLSHVARVARSDLDIGGRRIAAGDLVLLSLNGHDVIGAPHASAAADQQAHAFGYGIHYCLGAALARAEATVLLTRFCTRYPHARAVGPEPAWGGNSTYLRFEELRLDLGAPAVG
ncbi:cytochrome P450 [Streptomyces sp. NBC_00433]